MGWISQEETAYNMLNTACYLTIVRKVIKIQVNIGKIVIVQIDKRIKIFYNTRIL